MAVSTFIISFRSNIYGGAEVQDARGYQCDGLDPTSVRVYGLPAMARASGQRRILFMVHGFNVSWQNGLVSAARMHDDLRAPSAPEPLTDDTVFIGVLWPGDGKIPFVNYPWEAFDAVKCGRLLADTINLHFSGSAGVSFVSHSLGARVILTAAEHVIGPVEQLIVTAAAADADCLETSQHSAAYMKAGQTHVLTSKRDRTLRWAYPAGDFLSDIFGDGDNPFGGALGLKGPRSPGMKHLAHTPIPVKAGSSRSFHYDHCNYFPDSTIPRPNAPALRKSDSVSEYVSAAQAGRRYWPP
jgi:hypothetical protein